MSDTGESVANADDWMREGNRAMCVSCREKEPAAMKRAFRRRDSEQLAQELAALSAASVKHLKDRWRALYGTEPPRYISWELLTGAVAYRLQERTLGSLKPSTQRLLEHIGEGHSSNYPAQLAAAKATAGTVLIREWRGVSHRVTVLDDGVVYQGRRYQSLSEVARLITGSRWSGPLFFGLKNRAQEARHG
jgi:hypothetical protein